MGWGGPTYVTCWSRQRPRPPLDDMPWCRGDARTQFRPSSCKKPRGHLKLVKRYLRDRRDCVRLSGRGGERESMQRYVHVCKCTRVCGPACLPACERACAKLLLVGPSMTEAEVGAIICSAVISINTFLDAHTLSQRSCAQHPPRMWPAACRHMAASQALITTQQPVG